MRILVAALLLLGATPQDDGIAPVGADGQPLNLDFETGTLKDWTATGTAFDGQPIKGDTVNKRRGDMKSDHKGEYWIGTFEKGGDALFKDPPGCEFHHQASFITGLGAFKALKAETDYNFFPFPDIDPANTGAIEGAGEELSTAGGGTSSPPHPVTRSRVRAAARAAHDLGYHGTAIVRPPAGRADGTGERWRVAPQRKPFPGHEHKGRPVSRPRA